MKNQELKNIINILTKELENKTQGIEHLTDENKAGYVQGLEFAISKAWQVLDGK